MLVVGILAIAQLIVTAYCEVRWLFDLMGTCAWKAPYRAVAENLSSIACLVVCFRLVFQLFLGSGVLPFFESQVKMFVRQRSEKQMRIILLFLMILSSVSSPVFLSLACLRFWGEVTAPLCFGFVAVWIVVLLLGGQVYKSSLQLMIVKPKTRPKASRQIMLVREFCRRCAKRNYRIVVFVMALSLFIGYSVSKFMEERSQNIEENNAAVDCGSNLMVDGDATSGEGRSCLECCFVGKSSLADKEGNGAQNLSTAFELLAHSVADAFVMQQASSTDDAAQSASDMNDVMDEMLNRSEIPADYAETMVALFRDKSQGDVIRDFAVQHIGLYAETLQMRGKYDADASESATLRDALWDAAEETRTIVAVAAFRALADMTVFDPRIDVNRLDSRLASCVADASASPAARVMAAQLCGERGVVAAKSALSRIAADRREPDPLRLAAAHSARLLAE